MGVNADTETQAFDDYLAAVAAVSAAADAADAAEAHYKACVARAEAARIGWVATEQREQRPLRLVR